MTLRGILLKLLRRRRLQRDLETELAFHRDMARGRANPIAFGNVDRIQEESLDLWRFTLLEDLWRDIGYAIRSLRRMPAFAALSILTLALGIGATTSIFSLIDRVMLEFLPVQQPSQLIELLTDRGTGPFGSFSYQALQYFRAHTHACSSIIAASNNDFHALIEGRATERLSGQYVTGDYFSALGVNALAGRPLMPEDDRRGAASAVAVISYSTWQDRFGRSPDVIGKTLVLENIPFTIVGVAPAGFHGLEVGKQVDIWVPLEVEPLLRRPSWTSTAAYNWLQVVGRLKPDVSFEQGKAELRVLFDKAVVETAAPLFRDSVASEQVRNWSLVVEAAGSGLSGTRRQFSEPLLVLMAIVGILLLIACTNVANLLFARALAREKEIALRLSLGAGRSRLIRQLLTESAVLAAAGGVIGLFTAYLVSQYLAGLLATARSPIVLDVLPNLTILGFTAAVAVCTVLLFGLIPAFRSTDMDFASRLKGSGSGQSSGGPRWSGGLIVIEVALLMVLILGAGLLLRTLHNLNSIDLGFDRSDVLLVSFDPFGSGHTPEQLRILSTRLLEKVKTLPGVKAASLDMSSPVTGGGVTNTFQVNHEGAAPSVARNVYVNRVGPEYFAALRTPILAGRDFDPEDSATTPIVVMVNQSFALRYFGSASCIGQTISQNGMTMEIVGIVGDVKYMGVRDAMSPTVYEDVFQQPAVPSGFLIRTERDPETVIGTVRAEVKSIIGKVAIREKTLQDQIDASIVRERLVATLAAFFGGLALLLAVIGLYGVVNNSVARRTKEIGIRVALGVEPRDVVSMVLREVFVLVGGGIVLGLPLAILITRLIASLLYGLTPDDPLTVLLSVGALLIAALTAGFLPARRASRVDPMAALRME